MGPGSRNSTREKAPRGDMCAALPSPGRSLHSTHFNVTTTAMAPRQLLSQPHCRDGPGTRSWAEYGAAAHARCVAPTLDHFGANSGQKRPGIRPASLGHGAPRERQRHRSVRRTKTAYFSHCGLAPQNRYWTCSSTGSGILPAIGQKITSKWFIFTALGRNIYTMCVLK